MSPESVWKTCLSFVFEGAPIEAFSAVLLRSLMCESTREVPFVWRWSCCRPLISPTYELTPA